MAIPILTATKRNEKVKKTRKEGYTPAVIYGKSIQSTPIKFETATIVKLLKENGERTRIQLKVDDEIRIGIIKSVDTDSLTSEIQHLDIQVVEKNETVNWEIPILFVGKETLAPKRLLLQVSLSQIKVTGAASEIPDFITIDVSDKVADTFITIANLNLPAEIKTIKPLDTILAIIKRN